MAHGYGQARGLGGCAGSLRRLTGCLVLALVVVGLTAMHTLGHPTSHPVADHHAAGTPESGWHLTDQMSAAKPTLSVRTSDLPAPLHGIGPVAMCLTVLVAGFALGGLIRLLLASPAPAGGVTRVSMVRGVQARPPPSSRRLAQLSVLRT